VRGATLVLSLALIVAACGGGYTDSDKETEAIITAWNEGWLDGDPARLAGLHAEDGVLAEMGRGHLLPTDYPLSDLISIIFSDTGAVMELTWEGTHLDEPFTIEVATTFEITGGQILRGTDSYDTAAPPGGSMPHCSPCGLLRRACIPGKRRLAR
jgi:hypothetical protein